MNLKALFQERFKLVDFASLVNTLISETYYCEVRIDCVQGSLSWLQQALSYQCMSWIEFCSLYYNHAVISLSKQKNCCYYMFKGTGTCFFVTIFLHKKRTDTYSKIKDISDNCLEWWCIAQNLLLLLCEVTTFPGLFLWITGKGIIYRNNLQSYIRTLSTNTWLWHFWRIPFFI